MAGRLQLHEELCKILGNRNVYFQPPESIKMSYPCIRYSKGTPDLKKANNKLYSTTNRYEGVVIDHDPDSTIADDIVAHFQMCSLGTSYRAENLNHTPFTIYY